MSQLVIKNSFLHFLKDASSLKRWRRQSRACSDDECDYTSSLCKKPAKSDSSDISTNPPSSPRESIRSSCRSGRWADCEDSDSDLDVQTSCCSRDEFTLNMDSIAVADLSSFDSLEGPSADQSLVIMVSNAAVPSHNIWPAAQEMTKQAAMTEEEARVKALEMRAAQLQVEAQKAEEAAKVARMQSFCGVQTAAVSSSCQPAVPPGMWTMSPPGVFIKPETKDATKDFTTVMLRNCPNNLSRDELVALLNEQGLEGMYDFVYLPMDLARDAGLGYAFVNFTTNENALLGRETMEGFKEWPILSQKVCSTCWGNPLQGLEQHIDRYRNSPVMHDGVDDKYKPILLKDGVRQPFPRATKRIRLPTLKRAGAQGLASQDSEGSGENDA